MKSIRFYDYGLEDVIVGLKQSTLRLGEDGFREGDLVAARRNSGERFGYLRIVRKSKVRFSALSKADARLENWSSLAALKERLLFSYPRLGRFSVLTRYQFSFLPELPRRRGRGANVDLTRALPAKIAVVTGSASKAERYAKLLSGLGLEFSKVSVENPAAVESRNDPSCESRAAAKALAGKSSGLRLATDDMGLLELGGKCHAVANLGSLHADFLKNARGRARLTIRTALAIAHGGRCNTTVVYRSFTLRPKARPGPLNAMLYLEGSRVPVAKLAPTHPALIEPLRRGILDCLTGKAP